MSWYHLHTVTRLDHASNGNFHSKNFRSDCHRALCPNSESVSARLFPSEVRMSVSPTSSLSNVFDVIKRVYGTDSDKASTTVTGHKDSGLPPSHHRYASFTAERITSTDLVVKVTQYYHLT